METNTNTISLPEPLMSYAREQAVRAGLKTPDEYVQSVLAADQCRTVREKVEALLLEGLQSGDAVEVTPEFWERIRQRIQEKLAQAT
jgi:antitoxin ParD1/3/4